MNEFPASVEVLIEKYRQQPTIGKKTAQRLALHALKDPAATRAFARALWDVTEKCIAAGFAAILPNRKSVPFVLL